MTDPKISPETREAERSEMQKAHEPDRMPTPEEEELAERNDLDPSVSEHYEEMLDIGANQPGEGRLP